jgi:hypothetical protein
VWAPGARTGAPIELGSKTRDSLSALLPTFPAPQSPPLLGSALEAFEELAREHLLGCNGSVEATMPAKSFPASGERRN